MNYIYIYILKRSENNHVTYLKKNAQSKSIIQLNSLTLMW